MTEQMHTPPPITGYRALPQSTVDLMNKIKAHGLETQKLIDEVVESNLQQARDAHNVGDLQEEERIRVAEPNRWAAIARTELQQGLMSLTRAVAQPSGF